MGPESENVEKVLVLLLLFEGSMGRSGFEGDLGRRWIGRWIYPRGGFRRGT